MDTLYLKAVPFFFFQLLVHCHVQQQKMFSFIKTNFHEKQKKVCSNWFHSKHSFYKPFAHVYLQQWPGVCYTEGNVNV